MSKNLIQVCCFIKKYSMGEYQNFLGIQIESTRGACLCTRETKNLKESNLFLFFFIYYFYFLNTNNEHRKDDVLEERELLSTDIPVTRKRLPAGSVRNSIDGAFHTRDHQSAECRLGTHSTMVVLDEQDMNFLNDKEIIKMFAGGKHQTVCPFQLTTRASPDDELQT
jgi:hypothetical protein